MWKEERKEQSQRRVLVYVCKMAQGPLRGWLALVQLASIGLNAFRPLSRVAVSTKPVGNGPSLALMPKHCHGSGAGQGQQPPKVCTTCTAAQDGALARPVTNGPPQGQNSTGWGRLKDSGRCSTIATDRIPHSKGGSNQNMLGCWVWSWVKILFG